MTYAFTAAGDALQKSFETCVLWTYDDADPNHRPIKMGDRWTGTLTIGWGHTGATAYPGNVITQALADSLLETDRQQHVDGVANLLSNQALTQNQYSALVDLSFNIGLHAFSGSSALHLANIGELDQVPAHIMLWNKEHVGVELVESPGLTRRRQAECLLWELADQADVPDFQSITS